MSLLYIVSNLAPRAGGKKLVRPREKAPEKHPWAEALLAYYFVIKGS